MPFLMHATYTYSDLLATLEVLVERKANFDYILIETSGLADPGPVASCLWVDEELESQLRLDGIVTVVDAKNICRHLPCRQDNKDGSDDLKCHTEEALRQICVADRMLINKTDLVSEEEVLALEEDLRALNGMALVQQTTFSKIDLSFILGLDCYGPGRKSDNLPFLLPRSSSTSVQGGHHHNDHGHVHSSDVGTFALIEPSLEVDLDALRRWLASLLWQDDEESIEGQGHGTSKKNGKTEIYRMKGTLAVAGSDTLHILQVGRRIASTAKEASHSANMDLILSFTLQAVHETFEIEPSKSLTWPSSSSSSSSSSSQERECRLVVIGKGLDEDSLRRGFRSTAAIEPA